MASASGQRQVAFSERFAERPPEAVCGTTTGRQLLGTEDEEEESCISSGDAQHHSMVRTDSFQFRGWGGLGCGWFMVVANSSSDVLTKLLFQMLHHANEGDSKIDFVYDPTASLLMIFVLIIAALSFAAMSMRILFGGCPESVGKVPCIMWPFLGIIMLAQILAGALTFVFLPAAVVSALNNGLTILNNSAIRVCRGKKAYTLSKWCALFVVVLGCVMVGAQNYHETIGSADVAPAEASSAEIRHVIGFVCCFVLAFSIAVAGTLDDYLTKDVGVDSDFLAYSQAASASVYVILGLLIWSTISGVHFTDVLHAVAQAWRLIPWFKVVCILVIAAQAALKIVAVHVVSQSSATTASMFGAVSMVTTWLGSALLSWWSPFDQVGDACSGWGAFIRAVGMAVIILGIFLSQGACTNCRCCLTSSDDEDLGGLTDVESDREGQFVARPTWGVQVELPSRNRNKTY